MKNDIIECECGIRTREPFLIGGRVYCVVCAEMLAPALVARKATSWARFQSDQRVKRTPWKDVSWS